MLRRTVEINRLLDIYGELLTDRQKRILLLYYQQDFSLSEIAGEDGCSRQAVYDVIDRGSTKLHSYEKSLKFIQKSERREQYISELRQLLNGDLNPEIFRLLDQLE